MLKLETWDEDGQDQPICLLIESMTTRVAMYPRGVALRALIREPRSRGGRRKAIQLLIPIDLADGWADHLREQVDQIRKTKLS
jgi:hypothetical protein